VKAVAIAVVFAANAVVAQGGEMKGTEMKGDTKAMAMKDMSPSGMAKDAKTGKHRTKGTVKSVDAKAGTVTLDHEPVKSMSWPAMTMAFKVQDKALMDRFTQGKKVQVEFEQRGKDYVITNVK
jgi:Cu(I)/Ag(I) efflux system periplasmic protein CusF